MKNLLIGLFLISISCADSKGQDLKVEPIPTQEVEEPVQMEQRETTVDVLFFKDGEQEVFVFYNEGPDPIPEGARFEMTGFAGQKFSRNVRLEESLEVGQYFEWKQPVLGDSFLRWSIVLRLTGTDTEMNINQIRSLDADDPRYVRNPSWGDRKGTWPEWYTDS